MIATKSIPAFLSVLHVESSNVALQQVSLAVANGARGLFLINHSSSYRALLTTYFQIREQFPDLWLGLNFLDLRPENAFPITPTGVNALWFDNGDMSPQDTALCKEFCGSFGITTFAGAAFKYQNKGLPIEEEALNVAENFDVVTTSGDATGSPAALGKVKAIRQAIGADRKLALASGVTVENVNSYLPYVDHFLVATGISQTFTTFDPHRLSQMAQSIMAYKLGKTFSEIVLSKLS